MLRSVAVAVLFCLVQTGWAALTPAQIKTLPPAADHKINFAKEIKPIIEESCIRCHGRGRVKGGLSIDSRDTLLKGGDSGAAVVAGHGDKSYLLALVSGLDPDEVMPKKGKKLTPEQVGVVRAWIDQGMPWDPAITFAPVAPLNLDPRLPKIPEGRNEPNPVDRFMDVYFQQRHIKPAHAVEDRIYARRVYLDTIGLLPAPAEMNQFVKNRSPEKREKLVASLLSRNEDYAENWMSFWDDLLRNDYKGTGYIDGGRKQITRWLYSALRTNMPYDQFVGQLIAPTPDSAGFSDGIVWRGVVNASQKPQMQAAQNISQVFMGINLKCASCHDSFINDWQLSDSYGLANIYSDKPLEIYECDKPTGKKAAIKFLFPQLGEIAPTTNKQARLQELAGLVTCPKDGRLPRTIVNRLWAKFMGRGLIEPVDDMQQVAWNQDLLDWLADDLVAHHYDLKVTIGRILTSKAYQLPAVDAGEPHSGSYVFTGPEVRRMTAEEFRDALTSLTGVGYAAPDADLPGLESNKSKYTMKAPAKWVWNTPKAAAKAKAEAIYLRKTTKLTTSPTEAAALVACDNSFELYVNGRKVGSGNDYSKPSIIDLKAWLKKGDNLIAIRAVNNLPDNTAPTPEKAVAGTENPAGVILYARVRATGKARPVVMDFATDATWRTTNQLQDGWETTAFSDGNWPKVAELGTLGIPPWRLPGNTLTENFEKYYDTTHTGGVRAVLVAADPLTTALGRPNRDQVVTTRSDTATTLQALELTNGKTLAATLHRGAANLAARNESGKALVKYIYEQAIGRDPNRAEMKLASSLLGDTPKPADVEDFLWATAMLPEFQLIY
jgi:mono/diheme cytochrome c family protein